MQNNNRGFKGSRSQVSPDKATSSIPTDRRRRPNLYASIAVVIISICLRVAFAHAGHLEPFKAVTVPVVNPQTPEKIELGKKLFFDRRLSGDGTTSCATCHIPELGFADGQDISMSYPTTRNWRNSPTLINVAFQKQLFHDGRAETLEDQALFPMMSAWI